MNFHWELRKGRLRRNLDWLRILAIRRHELVTATSQKSYRTGSSSKTARASLFPGTAFLLSQFPPQTAPLQTGTKISNMVSTKFRAP